jgi:hypothetical protein
MLLDNTSSMSSGDNLNKLPNEISSSDDRDKDNSDQLYSESLETIMDMHGKRST